jgi:propionyl-CoA carboxylase beta chain
VGFEDLGGADVHAARSGVAAFVANDDIECLQLIRRLLGYLPRNNLEDPPAVPAADDPQRMDEALDGIVPSDPVKPYDMRDVIQRVVDRGSLLDVYAAYAPNIITALARLDGRVVGVIAQQPAALAGVLDIDSSVKGARFIRFCDAFNIPLVTFVDVPGFLPGVGQEHGGIIRHGAKLLYAYCEATVPKVAVVTRKAYGGAYDVMSSKHIRGDMNLAWPTAEIAVMGPEGAIEIVFRKELAAAEDPAALRARLVAEYRAEFATPYVAASRGYIDDVIEPRTTRPRLISALAVLATKRVSAPRRKHGNIPL